MWVNRHDLAVTNDLPSKPYVRPSEITSQFRGRSRMKKILRVIGNLAGLLILGALTVIVALNLRERQPHVMPASAVFQSPIMEPALTPRPSEPGTPTPGRADAAICTLYPTPPYPINLTPCPYYLTPPVDPVLIFTPAPRSTPVAPSIIVGPQTGTAKGSTLRPVYISRDYLGPGELCELRPSPDQDSYFDHTNPDVSYNTIDNKVAVYTTERGLRSLSGCSGGEDGSR